MRYYDLMIKYALHQGAYLDVAKYYYKIWETPSIKEDEDGKGREVRWDSVCVFSQLICFGKDTGAHRLLRYIGATRKRAVRYVTSSLT